MCVCANVDFCFSRVGWWPVIRGFGEPAALSLLIMTAPDTIERESEGILAWGIYKRPVVVLVRRQLHFVRLW